MNAVHVTHEAVYKVGGIGTVLEGLINSRPYSESTERTVLVCPLFYPERTQRLGPGGASEYSSLDGVFGGPYAEAFHQIEADYNVRLVYGRRALRDAPTGRRATCEVLLVDLRGIRWERIDAVKGALWQHYGIASDRYQQVWEYEQYVQLAGPALAALEALELASDAQPAVLFAHEFMGLPLALLMKAWRPARYRTLFYAHEVAPVRRIVEAHPGHDVMFYAALEAARREGLALEQVFGPQDDYFKHPLVSAARFCDATLAVGHHVVRELEFLHAGFAEADVRLAYNGIPDGEVTVEERRAARRRLQAYCAALLGWRPDLVFTHVTRLAVSKAMWRDLDVLAALEPELARRGLSAVLIVLSTEMPTKPAEEIRRMEREWDWPLAHREGLPDLTPGEARYYQRVQAFNARARRVRVLYLNQFGFGPELCGGRMPEEVRPLDLRCGTDVEFGLSLYEPFGISPLEPLAFGALCAVSTSCGCTGFVEAVSNAGPTPNIVPADFLRPPEPASSVQQALAIDAGRRRLVEARMAAEVAQLIMERLPQGAAQEREREQRGAELARRMSWDAVAERFILPAMRGPGGRRPASA